MGQPEEALYRVKLCLKLPALADTSPLTADQEVQIGGLANDVAKWLAGQNGWAHIDGTAALDIEFVVWQMPVGRLSKKQDLCGISADLKVPTVDGATVPNGLKGQLVGLLKGIAKELRAKGLGHIHVDAHDGTVGTFPV